MKMWLRIETDDGLTVWSSKSDCDDPVGKINQMADAIHVAIANSNKSDWVRVRNASIPRKEA